jgi:hypothetical protein
LRRQDDAVERHVTAPGMRGHATTPGRHAWCVCRSMLQQEERRCEHGTAEDCGDAEAPPLSALFPQGSTLLRGQCTRAGTGPAWGTGRT